MKIRIVGEADVSAVRRLVESCPPLTLHTAVTYGVLFHQFSNLCFVAEDSSGLIGFISSLRGTVNPAVVYIWQLGVVPEARGKRISHKLIEAAMNAGRALGCTVMQVGIEPSNELSLKVFRSYAAKRGQELREVGSVDFSDQITGSLEHDVIWEMPAQE